MNNVILTGFMGTGKTTVGGILARRFGVDFVDTDAEIERRAGCTVAEYFAREGEGAFRELEAQVFEDTVHKRDLIVSTGGGTLVNPANQRLLNDEHTVICLTCDPEVVAERLDGTRARPLLDTGRPDRIRALLAEREDTYSRYRQVDTSHLSAQQVARRIADLTPLAEAASFAIPRCQTSTVLFEEGLLIKVGTVLARHGLTGPVLLVTDSHVDGLPIVESLRASLVATGLHVHTYAMPQGEKYKTLQTLEGAYQAAMQAGLDRSATVIGVGGGVVGDMAGMLAATYLRGIHLVLIPTTLLAQVDAAIGGKVGVDFHMTKNMIGAFKPADLVLIDPSALLSLPPSALADGMAEVIKIGYMCSRPLVSRLDGVSLDNVLGHPRLIRAAARQKVEIVRRDPLERGERMLLNFGHTIGHGLEAASGYDLSHGQAVSIGMVAETRMAVSRGWCAESVLAGLRSLLQAFALPTDPENMDLDLVVRFVGQDKKRQANTIRLAIPRDIGDGHVVDVTLDEVRLSLQESENV